MFHCAVCSKDSSFSNFKTIGEQIVCSLACVRLLKSNSRDACDYCKYPVWIDNYYKINNKLYCSEICKNKMVKKLKLSNDSLVKHHKENIFSNNNGVQLKNSRQLRDEVLKFFKDFHFDTNIDDEEEAESSKKNNNKNYIKINNNKKYNTKSTNDEAIITINDNSDNKNQYNNTSRSIHKKNFTQINSTLSIDKKNKEESNNTYNKSKISQNINSTIKSNIANKYKMSLNKTNELTNKYKLKINLNDQFSRETLPNKTNTLSNTTNSNQIQKYSFIDKNDNNNKSINQMPKINFISFNSSNITPSKNGPFYLNLNKETKKKKKKECMYCGEKIGAATFFDRNKNRFCSDSCKEEFFKKYK